MIQAIQEISKDNSLESRPISILEMGTGTGILAIFLIRTFKIVKIIVTDISPVAAELAADNIDNSLFCPPPQINIVVMDLFNGFQTQPLFDLIVFNPPYIPTSQEESSRGGIFQSWAGGKDGTEIIYRFFEKVSNFLVPKGQVLLLLSSLNKIPEIREFAYETYNLLSQTIISTSLGYENLQVLRFFLKNKEKY